MSIHIIVQLLSDYASNNHILFRLPQETLLTYQKSLGLFELHTPSALVMGIRLLQSHVE